MKKILIIEDERIVQDNIRRLLEAENFHALVADNGNAGVQLAQTQEPDLILCDIMLPELDGYDILTVLRQDPLTSLIPFIFLTAKVEREDLRQGMELGADDYLTKPFTRSELLGAITARLAKQEALLQQYLIERQRNETLEQKLQEMQQFTQAKDNLLSNLCEELRNPLSNVRMAIQMLRSTPPGVERDRYLDILQQEFARELALLNQATDLQRFLTPENVKLLRQFHLLIDQANEKNSSD